MSNSFIPEGYAQPTSGGGFTKLETGDNTLRIPVFQFLCVECRDSKLTRSAWFKDQRRQSDGKSDSVKHAGVLSFG
jgi:hypothetical protein